ncbi:hypothetical protein MUY27_11245 [Mucilaginibacter sp. RS28]|uniref:CCDC81-like prokaryotic HU domain-containing protein n=1 Tax=Mucilaginibacter straminoryzae TaxID=2932774 RepID=A0A9X2B962_9SPHI|nr:hypothetical protein [Mucilaginibacter straminoryzae]MCJ8210284.1 hypothetical protein [Mucilaginibacter straminoryzae]
MDLANYASELIKQHGALIVPGLGYFAHVRRSAYYDAETGTIYPPYFEITFDPFRRDVNDTTMAAYITERKNISLASASYFLDKYISKIKLQAETEEVAFADLGYFYLDAQAKLAFRPSQIEMRQNASLFGYQPVQLQKIKDLGLPVKPRPAVEPISIPLEEEPVAEEATAETLSEQDDTYQPTETSEPAIQHPTEKAKRETIDEQGPVLVTNVKETVETESWEESSYPADETTVDENDEGSYTSSNMRFWVILSLVVILATGGLIWYYKYRFGIAAFNKKTAQPATTVPKPATTPAATTAKFDTATRPADTANALNKAPVKSDSLQANPATATNANTADQNMAATPAVAPEAQPVTSAAPYPPVKDLPKGSWLVLGGHFKNYDNAVKTLEKYRNYGYKQARLIDSVKHTEYYIYQIVFGYRKTRHEAVVAVNEILNEHKIKPELIYVLQYKQKQK